jgi:hypothetical protein
MALPNINQQTFELNVPSTDEKIKFRPFLVREEKILLQALESNKLTDIASAVNTIIENCTFNKIEVDKLPSFDLEYIFLNIRAKSVGEIAKIKVLSPDDKKTYVETNVDLTKINVEVDVDHTNKIELTDTAGVIMRYPTLEMFIKNDYDNPKADDLIKMFAECIDQIYDGDDVYDYADTIESERIEFLENLTKEQFDKITQFFSSMPRLKHEVKLTNPITKKKGKVTLEGLRSFF